MSPIKLRPLSIFSASILILGSLALSPLHAQQAGDPASWFTANPAWSKAVSVTTTDDGAKLMPVSFSETPKILVLPEAKPGTPQLHAVGYLGDTVVHLEYMLTAETRAAIFLQGRYRIQLDGEGAGTLGPVQKDMNTPAEIPIVPPLRVVASTPGVWQTLDARLRIPRFDEARNKTQNALILEVKINGQIVQSNAIVSGWCKGTETWWEDAGGYTTISVESGGFAIREFSARSADFSAIELPKASGQPTNEAKLIDYVKRGEENFRGFGCIECHAIQRDDLSQKTGPNLFGLFTLEPRDRPIATMGEDHRFTIKADRNYLHRSVRTPTEELAVVEHGPAKGTPSLPAMPPFFPAVLPDANVDAIGAFLGTLNEFSQQGPVVKLVRETGLENYDPMTDRMQLLVDRTVRIQRGPMEGTSGRAIHVGLPNSINYTFDPRVLAITQIWQGGFLDASGEFLNRGGLGLKRGYESREIKLGDLRILIAPLSASGQPIDFSFKDPVFKDGEAVRASLHSPRDQLDRLAEIDAQFLGYSRDSVNPAAAPAFRYRIGQNTIALRTDIATDGQVQIVLDGECTHEQSFTINEALLGTVQVSAGSVKDGRWIIPAGNYRGATALGRLTLAPNSWHAKPSAFDYRRQPLVVESSKSELPRGYTADAYRSPKDNYGRDQLFEPLGMALAPDGTIVVATRTAGIWRLVKGEWHLFAEGLFDCLGVQIEDEKGLVVVVGQKPELTRVSDTNGDGLADRFDTLCDQFTYNGNYHAYLHGPVRTAGGDYVVTLNLNDSSQGDIDYKAGGKYMGTGGGYRGWAIFVPAQGGFKPLADGLRSPASLGCGPNGRIWYADNQGEFMGTSKLFLLTPGGFYGHPSSLVDRPGMTPASPEIAWEKVQSERESAVVLFPQGRLANSPGNPVWDTTGGRFGAFDGQMLLGDQTQSNLMRVTTERIGEHEQGAAINFATNLESGVIRPLFLPDGSLLLGQTGRGWQAKGGHVASLQRVRWDGKTIAPAIHHVSAVAGGFQLSFTVPVPAALTDSDLTKALAIKSWVYRDAPDYGSPELDEHVEDFTKLTLSADRTSLHVTLAKTEQPKIHPQQTARVYQITLNGKGIWNEDGPGFEAFYTLYSFPAK